MSKTVLGMEEHMGIGDLFRPKWKHSNAAVRLSAVPGLTDENVLSDIAQHDADRGVRIAAVEKLSNQHLLQRIVRNETDADVARAAFQRINDQSILAEISRSEPRAVVRLAAVKKLNAPAVLAELLKRDTDFSVREAALDKVADQGALVEAARSDREPAIRMAAMKKIKTQSILAELLATEGDARVRTIIVEQLKDHALLGTIAQQHPVSEIRTSASKKLAELLRATIMLDDSGTAISLLGIPGDHHLDPDHDGWTPLHFAAFKGDLEVLELLLSKGAPPDTRDNRNKWTALHYVAAHGHNRLVAPLIKAGADPNAVSGPEGNTPLHIAVAMGYPPGYISSNKDKADFIRREADLFKRQADLRKVLQGHPDVASELLKHGANPNTLTREGRTPLHLVAERGDIVCGEVLVAGGADLNARGAQEATALHWAAAKKNGEFGKWLVEKGAAPDLTDTLGWTPLFLADANGASELVPVLLAAGARTQATINGKSVSFRATKGQEASPPTGNDPDEGLIEASETGNYAAAKFSIDAGADVNVKSRDGWTPLLSASKDYPKIVELLLANGADPNAGSDRGYTPLMRAAGNGAEKIVHLLLAAGADKRVVDCNGKTAYRLAVEMHQRTCAQLVLGSCTTEEV
jgi:ankyrin repeat protein